MASEFQPVERNASDGSPPHSDIPGFRQIAIAVGCLFLAAALLAAWQRGLWYDEAWTLFEAGHDVGFATSLHDRWLNDVSPPYYYFLAWLFRPLTGDEIFGSRLINLVPTAIALAAFLLIARRDPERRPFLLLFAILLCATPYTLQYFAEYRPYYWTICGAAVVAAGLQSVTALPTDFERRDLWLLLTIAAGLLLGFSFHYVSALPVGIVTATFIVGLWVFDKRRWSVALTIAAIATGLPLVAVFLMKMGLLRTFGDKGWIDTTTGDLLNYYMLVGGLALIGSFAAIVAALLVGRPADDHKFASERQFVTLTVIGLVLWAVALLALNAVQPMGLPRYLLGAVPFVPAAAAAYGCHAFVSSSRARWAILAYALMIFAASAWITVNDQRWYATARIVASIAKSCPDTAVHAIPHWQVEQYPQALGPNETAVARGGYEEVARRFGIRLEPAGSGRVSATCPTLLWTEHYTNEPVPKRIGRIIEQSGLSIGPEQAQKAEVRLGSTGFVTIIPANDASPAAQR